MTSALDGSDVRKSEENVTVRRLVNPCSLDNVSPDGSRVAFTDWEHRELDDIQVLYVNEYPREVDDFGEELVVVPAVIDSPRWSPDGRRLAFVEWEFAPDIERRRWRIAMLSGSDLKTMRQVADGFGYGGRGAYQLAWSPDGAKLLISSFSFVSVVNADGSGSRTLVNLRYNSARQLRASWSPDGSKIAVYNGSGFEATLFTMSPDGSDKRVLAPYGNPIVPAQTQEWDPRYEAPTPTPAPAMETANP